MVDFRIDVVIDPRGAVTGTTTVEKSLLRLENSADRLRLGLGRAFAFLAGGAGVSAAVRVLAQFEQSMSTVRAVSGATADQFDQLNKAVQELGLTTRFSAGQAADALGDLSRAGFTAEESMSALGDTLLLAQAGGLGLAEAADIAATTIRGFRLEADQMGRVADVLAAIANKTNTSVGEMGEGLKFVAPIAAGLGVTLEQTAAAMGVLSDAGLKASLAGTGLRRVLSELESPSANSQKILARLGVSADEVRVSQVGLAQAIERLGQAGLTTGQALEVFGDRGGPAFEVLAKNADRVKLLTELMNNVAGSAQTTADIMDDNLNGALLKVKASFQGLIITLGQAGVSEKLASFFVSLLDSIRFLAANADSVLRFFENLALLLGPRFLLGALRAITTLMLANPFVLLATGIALAATAIPQLQEGLDQIVKMIQDVGAAILEGIDFGGLVRGFAKVIDDTVALFAGLGAALGVVFDNLATQPARVGELMLKAFRDAIEATLDFFLAFGETVGRIILGVGKDILEIVANASGAIGAISVGNLEAAQTFADNVTGTLSRMGNRVATFTGQFKQNLRELREEDLLPKVELTDDARELGNAVSDAFNQAVADSTPTAQQTLDGLMGTDEDLAATAAQKGKATAEGFKSGFGEVTVTNTGDVDVTAMSARAQELFDQIDSTRMLQEETDALNEILRQQPELLDEINTAYLDMQIAALASATSAEAGFQRAFLKIRKEAEDLASVTEAIVDTLADHMTDALVEAVTEGTFSWREFAEGLLKDLTRIIARLLVVQALNAAIGALGGGGVSVSGAMAEGGTTQPGRSYLVGENGPELFTPDKTGAVQPLSAASEQKAPQVNVQVVNVTDPNEVPQAIAGGKADEAILNALARNPDRVKQVIA